MLIVIDRGDNHGINFVGEDIWAIDSDEDAEDKDTRFDEERHRIVTVRSTFEPVQSSMVAWSIGCEALEKAAENADDEPGEVYDYENETEKDARAKLRPPPSLRIREVGRGRGSRARAH